MSAKASLSIAVVAITISALYFSFNKLRNSSPGNPLRVLSYGSFSSSWGPGPELAEAFRSESGIDVQFYSAGDAGLILKKLDLMPADVVLGFDELQLPEARAARPWQNIERIAPGRVNARFRDPQFVAFDWAPLTFVFRNAEIAPPTSLEDLLDARFRGQIALEDPRTSAPGLQFFLWVLDDLGIDEGFRYFVKLKSNIRSVASGWTEAYGSFTSKGGALLVFSYQTSPVYHWVSEHDLRYRAAEFSDGHPAQIEYAAIPRDCVKCIEGEKFLDFLLSPRAQKILMTKNFMMPVLDSVRSGTEFAKLPELKLRAWKNLPELLAKRGELFSRWRELGM